MADENVSAIFNAIGKHEQWNGFSHDGFLVVQQDKNVLPGKLDQEILTSLAGAAAAGASLKAPTI